MEFIFNDCMLPTEPPPPCGMASGNSVTTDTGTLALSYTIGDSETLKNLPSTALVNCAITDATLSVSSAPAWSTFCDPSIGTCTNPTLGIFSTDYTFAPANLPTHEVFDITVTYSSVSDGFSDSVTLSISITNPCWTALTAVAFPLVTATTYSVV